MMELTYSTQGDYSLPNLLPPQESEVPLGKYGLLRKNFLEEHRKVTFVNLLTSGRLNAHLLEIEQTAHTRLAQMIPELAKAQGVTESLKAADQMKWVGLMNNIRSQAEETILNELIYS